jgi:hypothetical protein
MVGEYHDENAQRVFQELFESWSGLIELNSLPRNSVRIRRCHDVPRAI